MTLILEGLSQLDEDDPLAPPLRRKVANYVKHAEALQRQLEDRGKGEEDAEGDE